MIKKILSLIIILCTLPALVSCSRAGDDEAVATDRWNGIYVWTDEETEEFKVLDVEGLDDKNIRFTLESVRSTVEFEAPIKSDSGRYVVTNLGQRSVKITLSTDGNTVTIDDMWTDAESSRQENWTGKYQWIGHDETPESFGNPAWNGEYVCKDTGLKISVYGIKEGFVLFSYKVMEEDEEVVYNLRCLEPEPTKAVFTQDERLVILDIIKNNGKIKVTDLYMNDSENKGISGVYEK